MRVDTLPKGRSQPFYHVLVDDRDSTAPGTTSMPAFVEKPSINDLLLTTMLAYTMVVKLHLVSTCIHDKPCQRV